MNPETLEGKRFSIYNKMREVYDLIVTAKDDEEFEHLSEFALGSFLYSALPQRMVRLKKLQRLAKHLEDMFGLYRSAF